MCPKVAKQDRDGDADVESLGASIGRSMTTQEYVRTIGRKFEPRKWTDTQLIRFGASFKRVA